MVSTVWTNDNIAQIALALIMSAPEHAAGVMLMCVALGAVTPDLRQAAASAPQITEVLT